MIPLFLTILVLWVPIAILKPFGTLQKFLVLVVILIHLTIILLGHYIVLSYTNEPVILDDESDAWAYYRDTRVFEDYPPFSITKLDLVAATNRSAHLGYDYVLGTLTTITSQPVLAVRLLKTLVFFVGLTCVMRVWRRNYGSSLPMYGFIFLTLLFMRPCYYNFRNLKDGLIFGLFLLLMALLDTLLRPNWQRLVPRTSLKTAMGWTLVLALLWAILSLRFYLPPVIGAAILMHFVTASRMEAKMRFGLIVAAAIVTMFVLRSAIGAAFFQQVEEYGGGPLITVFGIAHGLTTPIPWQHAIRILIPTHCFYLALLPIATVAFSLHFRKNLTWHLYLVMMLIPLLGVRIGDESRKRLPIVPILVMWVLADLAYRNGTHIDQTQYQIQDEQELSEEQEFADYDQQEELLYYK